MLQRDHIERRDYAQSQSAFSRCSATAFNVRSRQRAQTQQVATSARGLAGGGEAAEIDGAVR